MRVWAGRGVAASVVAIGAVLACGSNESGSVSAAAGAGGGGGGGSAAPLAEDGAPCATAAECEGAYCVEGECTSGKAGQHCRADAHCGSRICVESDDRVGDPRCGSGMTGSPCANDADCFSRLCTAGACSTGAPCTEDSDCKNEQSCFTPAEGAPHCYRGGISEPCRRNEECVTDLCAVAEGGGLGECVTAPP